MFHKILKSACKRGVEAQDCPASDQSDLAVLHLELAGLLDDDAQPLRYRHAANPGVDCD